MASFPKYMEIILYVQYILQNAQMLNMFHENIY